MDSPISYSFLVKPRWSGIGSLRHRDLLQCHRGIPLVGRIQGHSFWDIHNGHIVQGQLVHWHNNPATLQPEKTTFSMQFLLNRRSHTCAVPTKLCKYWPLRARLLPKIPQILAMVRQGQLVLMATLQTEKTTFLIATTLKPWDTRTLQMHWFLSSFIVLSHTFFIELQN
jgi:hypothetical protein